MISMGILFTHFAGWLSIVLVFLFFFEIFRLATYGKSAHTPGEAKTLRVKDKKALKEAENAQHQEIKTANELLGQLRFLLAATLKGRPAMDHVGFAAKIELVHQGIDVLEQYEKREEEDEKKLRMIHGKGKIKNLLEEEDDLLEMLEKVIVETKVMYSGGKAGPLQEKQSHIIASYIRKAIKIVEHIITINGEEIAAEQSGQAELGQQSSQARTAGAREIRELTVIGNLLLKMKEVSGKIEADIGPDSGHNEFIEIKSLATPLIVVLNNFEKHEKIAQKDEALFNEIVMDHNLDVDADHEHNLAHLLHKLIAIFERTIPDDEGNFGLPEKQETLKVIHRIRQIIEQMLLVNQDWLDELERDERGAL